MRFVVEWLPSECVEVFSFAILQNLRLVNLGILTDESMNYK